MLKRINKTYVYVIVLLIITISLVIGFSITNQSISLVSGNITMTTPTCNNSKLYDRLACMSTSDYSKSRNLNTSVLFGSRVEGTSGLYQFTKTKNDDYPIYYFRAHINKNWIKNNIKFGGFCWKILRTTSTGGTKLVYNGEVKQNGECSDDTSDSHIIGNSSYGSGNFDYMKVNRNIEYINFTNERMTFKYNINSSANLSFSTSYTYDSNLNKYTLVNPQNYTWSQSYQSLNNYYTCSRTTTANECEQLMYVTEPSSTSALFLILENGETVESVDKTIAFASSYQDNGNGTYTLQNPEHIKKSEWQNHYTDNYYYACPDNNETCSNIQSIKSKDIEKYIYNSVNNSIKLGKSITYNGTNYILHDTIDFWDFSNTESIADLYDYNYTFYGLNDNSSIYLIMYRGFFANNPYFYGNELTDGDLVPRRTEDTPIKAMVDEWYSNNLLSVSSMIEDTPYCFDQRSYKYGSGTSIYYQSYASLRNTAGVIDLDCEKDDRYTVGNTGNGLLTYPIGLLTIDEINMAGYNNSYLQLNEAYYLMTPYTINAYIYYYDGWEQNASSGNKGVRPVISLKNSVQITSGTGTLADPYIVS